MRTIKWVVRRWRALLGFGRKLGALSLIVLFLLPICSTADDFHTCTLHRVPPAAQPFQFSPTTGDDQEDHPECLACQWQAVADDSLLVFPLHTVFPIFRAGHGEHTNVLPCRLYTVRHERAPPLHCS